MAGTDQRIVFSRLPLEGADGLGSSLDGLWIVVNRIDGTPAAETTQALRGPDAPTLGYYDEWYVFAADPGPRTQPLPSFVNDGSLWLLFSEANAFEPRDRDLLRVRAELAVGLDHAMATSTAVPVVWGLEELLVAERPELGLAQTLRGALE